MMTIIMNMIMMMSIIINTISFIIIIIISSSSSSSLLWFHVSGHREAALQHRLARHLADAVTICVLQNTNTNNNKNTLYVCIYIYIYIYIYICIHTYTYWIACLFVLFVLCLSLPTPWQCVVHYKYMLPNTLVTIYSALRIHFARIHFTKSIVHYENTALAKKTSVLVCKQLCYYLFVEPSQSFVNDSNNVPRRVCGHILKPCLKHIVVFRLRIRNSLYSAFICFVIILLASFGASGLRVTRNEWVTPEQIAAIRMTYRGFDFVCSREDFLYFKLQSLELGTCFPNSYFILGGTTRLSLLV